MNEPRLEGPPPPVRGNEPAFNAPFVVLGLIGAMVLVQIAQGFMSGPEQAELLLRYAFVPARYGPAEDGTVYYFPGAIFADLWTFLTHTFLHAGWVHLLVNAVWLLAFGSVVARRIGAVRFLVLYFICGIAGALTHLLIYPGSLAPVVGASAAISGIMGAAIRFVFLVGGPLGMLSQGGFTGAIGVPGAPRAEAGILQSLKDPRALLFVAVFIGMNLMIGLVGLGFPGEGGVIAWEAHVGGFLAGLLLFGLFDPPRRSPSGGPGNVGYGEWPGARSRDRDENR